MNAFKNELYVAWLAGVRDFPRALVFYGLFTILFAALTFFFPFKRGQSSLWSRRVGMDSLYWFTIGPMVSFLSMLCWEIVGDAGFHHTFFYDLSSYPLWAQIICLLAIGDFIGYWAHRALHHAPRWVWRLHVIHHGSTELDWLSTARNHPLNNLVIWAVTSALLGIATAKAAAFVAAFNLFYTVFVHANLNWTLGPLRYVIASPIFHRWHHTFPDEGGNKNFAPVFSCFDLVFGSFYMPVDKRPVRLGTTDYVPETFTGQLLYPFRYPLRRIKVKSEA